MVWLGPHECGGLHLRAVPALPHLSWSLCFPVAGAQGSMGLNAGLPFIP